MNRTTTHSPGRATGQARHPATRAAHSDWVEILARLGFAAKGVVYMIVGVLAVQAAFGSGGGGGTQTVTAKVLSNPFGAWLVGLAGVAVIAYGLKAAYRAYARKYRGKVAFGHLDARARTLIDRAGRLGLSARAVVFGLIGIFLIEAAVRSDPSQARGLDGALDTLAAQPYGPWLLGLVAIGLACYGFYSLVKARYRTFHTG